jgi:hypothetical protein
LNADRTPQLKAIVRWLLMTLDELLARGYDHLRAELLAVFVPLGLARAVIARLPANPPIHLSENAIVCDANRQLVVKLASVPEFQTARHIGEETFTNGVIPRELFRSMVGFSVELKLANRILDAGEELDGATIAAPHLLRLADTPGFESWYQTISACSN